MKPMVPVGASTEAWALRKPLASPTFWTSAQAWVASLWTWSSVWPQNEHAAVRVSGVSYAVAGAAITINSVVIATTAGKVIDASTRNTTLGATRDYTIGIALSAANADGDIITVLVRPLETEE